MQELPNLVVAPIEQIRPHEDFDPFRVERLKNRIDGDGTQLNPMVCAQADDSSYVLLDGATRREAFSQLGFPHVIVQVVDPSTVTLGTWHHVLGNGDRQELLDSLDTNDHVKAVSDHGTPRIHVSGEGWQSIEAVDVSLNTGLNALVDCYHGKMTVTRVTDPSVAAVSSTHDEWVAIVEFPELTIEDVMEAATQVDFVPAGITRFVVPARALRLNIPLEFLRDPMETAEKQDELNTILTKRARAGRIRRYDEPVIILDD